jgi:hypothetical protein
MRDTGVQVTWGPRLQGMGRGDVHSAVALPADGFAQARVAGGRAMDREAVPICGEEDICGVREALSHSYAKLAAKYARDVCFAWSA